MDLHLTELFDVFSRQMIKEIVDFSKFSFPLKEKNNWSMYEVKKERNNELDPLEVLYLLKDKKIVDSLLRFPWEGYRHDTYSFIGNDFFVSGGAYGILEAYDYNTNLISRFVGHEGDMRSITTSANGNFMITSGTDMTMRLWPINKIGKNKGDVNSIYPVVSILLQKIMSGLFGTTKAILPPQKKEQNMWVIMLIRAKVKKPNFIRLINLILSITDEISF